MLVLHTKRKKQDFSGNLSYPVADCKYKDVDFTLPQLSSVDPDLFGDYTTEEVIEYVLRLSKKQRETIMFLVVRCMKAVRVRMRNSYISSKLRYHFRNVRKVTSLLHGLGIIIKNQVFCRSANDFIFNPLLDAKKIHMALLNSLLTAKEMFFKMYNNIPTATLLKSRSRASAPLNESLIEKGDSLFNKADTDSRTMEVKGASAIRKINNSAPFLKKGVGMSKEGMKLSDLGLNQVHLRVVKQFDLEVIDAIKLPVFEPKVLTHALFVLSEKENGQPATRSVGAHVAEKRAKDGEACGFGLFLKVCQETSDQWRLKVDWREYYRLCEMVGIHNPQERDKAAAHKRKPQTTPSTGRDYTQRVSKYQPREKVSITPIQSDHYGTNVAKNANMEPQNKKPRYGEYQANDVFAAKSMEQLKAEHESWKKIMDDMGGDGVLGEGSPLMGLAKRAIVQVEAEMAHRIDRKSFN